jgi:hypothetical protein
MSTCVPRVHDLSAKKQKRAMLVEHWPKVSHFLKHVLGSFFSTTIISYYNKNINSIFDVCGYHKKKQKQHQNIFFAHMFIFMIFYLNPIVMLYMSS